MQYKTLKYLFFTNKFEIITKISKNVPSIDTQEHDPENLSLVNELNDYNNSLKLINQYEIDDSKKLQIQLILILELKQLKESISI